MASYAREFIWHDVEVLRLILSTPVHHFSIEFLRSERGEKPRVVFRLKTLVDDGFEDRDGYHPPIYQVCQISMKHRSRFSDELAIGLMDKVKGARGTNAPPFDVSPAAVAAFYFKVKCTFLPLKRWLNTLCGRHEDFSELHRADLTDFSFETRKRGDEEILDGCRDFV